MAANDLKFKMMYLIFGILKIYMSFDGKLIVDISLGGEYKNNNYIIQTPFDSTSYLT